MSLETNSFEFGEFLLDTKEKVLFHKGTPLSITPKAFQLLQILVEKHGHLVERDELIKHVWANSFVEEGNLSFTIRLLRKALGDTTQNPRFIETVPKRGYRFIALINEIPDNSPAVIKDGPNNLFIPPPKPYFLLGLIIISVISLFGISFVWFSGENLFLHKQPGFSRLTTNGKVTNMAISRDGEFLVFAQKEGVGEGLWVRELKTGNQKQLLPPQEGEFDGLTVSPANDYVYYTVFSKNAVVTTLSRLPLKGGSPESVSNIEIDMSVSFSPDGQKFAFTESFSSLKKTVLKIANADGSNQQVLVTANGDKRFFPNFKSSSTAWSPDGETIACAMQEFDESGSAYRILLVNPTDGGEKYLSEKRWAYIENISWMDNENLVVINQEPSSSINQIWEISRQTGNVKQLTQDAHSYQWLSSAKGKLYAVQKNIFSSLHVADSVENTETFQAKQIFGETGKIENVGWSLNEKIFYNSWSSGKNEIWQINSNGTAPQQLTRNSNLILSFAVSPVDNKFVFPTQQNGKISLSMADSNGENIHQLTDGVMDVSPVFSPDGKIVTFQRDSAQPTLWQTATDGSSPPVQITGYLAINPALSPDGQKIAYHFMDYGGKNPSWKLGLISSENHRLVHKLDFPLPIRERKIVWRPKTDLLTMIFYNNESAGILLLSPLTGKYQTVENIGSGKITDFDWSADGTRFAFSQSFETNDVVQIKDVK